MKFSPELWLRSKVNLNIAKISLNFEVILMLFWGLILVLRAVYFQMLEYNFQERANKKFADTKQNKTRLITMRSKPDYVEADLL